MDGAKLCGQYDGGETSGGRDLHLLTKAFPHVNEEELRVQACKVAHSMEDTWKKIVRELNQKNDNEKIRNSV